LGILAHVDAGKTSLTERLLFAAGVIDEIGSVDRGSTQTDTLALERQRGITIKSAVASFSVGDVKVNLIDTPGHPDFIAEVERVLGVLDGAVLVVSAVEGVQAQTRLLMRALQRLRIPTIIFINKIDRAGADTTRVLQAVARRLSPAIIAMGAVADQGSRGADFEPCAAGDARFIMRLAELLAEHDDALLADYVTDERQLSYGRLRAALAAQTRQALVHPVFLGSAITGAGVGALTAGIAWLLPAPRSGAGPGEAVRATVFKVERGPAGEKIGYVRVFAGTLRVRERVALGPGRDGKLTSISVFDGGTARAAESVSAGQIAKVSGLQEVRIGDRLGQAAGGLQPGGGPGQQFAPPTLETVVVPRRSSDKGALRTALAQMAESDPLINLRQDDLHGEIIVSLYGEVQKEIIGATLADDFGIDAAFRETTTICIERPVRPGAAAEFMDSGTHPFRASLGLRIDPSAIGSGVGFRLEIEAGALPSAFAKAVHETVDQALEQGLFGWQVTDCTVTVTHSGYVPAPPQGWSKYSSSAGDFRNLTPLVLMSALTRAGTQVHEPMHRFSAEIPADTLGPVLPVLARLRAAVRTSAGHDSLCMLEGDIPAASVHQLHTVLASLTRGEGVADCTFDHYQLVSGTPPARPRTDHNPLNRKEYLLHVSGTWAHAR
jgi:ribosomal protection tetracycline resistance protein